MCIIVYKPIGEACPSWRTLKTCFNNNPDGCGFMYAEDNSVHIHKGFMSWRRFKTAFKPYKNRQDLPIVLHFRITTNGATLPQNTHPFPLTESVGELRALDFDCNVGIAHNGIISMTSYAKKMSDTMEFIRKYAGCVVTSPTWYYNANANKVLAELIKSKMLVLSNDGHGEIVGDGWEHEDGVWYSNESYIPWEDRYAVFSKNRTYRAYDYSYLGDYWESDAWESEYGTWYGNTETAADCPYWSHNYPVMQCIECADRAYCWSEEELNEIGAII